MGVKQDEGKGKKDLLIANSKLVQPVSRGSVEKMRVKSLFLERVSL